MLLAEGFLHYLLVFEFDILMGYAVAAMISTFLVGRSERAINRAMWAFGGVHVLLFGAVSLLVFLLTLQQPGALEGGIFAEGAARVYESGSWGSGPVPAGQLFVVSDRTRLHHPDERFPVPAWRAPDALRRFRP